MKTKSSSRSAFSIPRLLLAVALCSFGSLLAIFGFSGLPATLAQHTNEPPRYMPVPGGETDDLNRMEVEWHNRLTYPTGRFDPAWVRRAAEEDARIERAIPLGIRSTDLLESSDSPLGLNVNSFTALGPQPERMTGCSGCYDYGTTAGRVNAIAVDPTTTAPGSITAYIAAVGGGIWKSTTCCTGSTTWAPVTDNVLTSTTSVDTVVIDPSNHDTIYAGTGDLNFGSFSMGSQGILKSTDAGATWTVLGANIFGSALPVPVGAFPQYQAIGKVRVDPNNSNNIVAGTKTGLYFSYDAGANWSGPCTTNSFDTQRQDITGLELTNVGGVTRILAAVGTRGFATMVQFNLDQNGANGIYKGTMPASGCATDFTPITRNDTGFVFGTVAPGSPYSTGANMNGTSGTRYAGMTAGNQLGRIDIAVAPSNPNYIYAQVGSIAPNSSSGCGNAAGCQLGVWASTDGGGTWSFMTGSAGGSLTSCAGGPGSGDYPQNWYDQGMAVDPNNPDRVFVDTFDTWLATRTGVTFYNLTCGYNGSSLANHVVHVDHHALAFLPGSSSTLLEGSDGGIFGSTNADTAIIGLTRNTWFNMDNGLNTIEFYSGDISGNFSTSSTPQAVAGAQDNGASSVLFSGNPSATQWQMGLGGDGFFARMDPVGTGGSLRFWQGNNSGGISRCIGVTSTGAAAACTSPGATWTSKKGGWGSDTQSFVLPFEIFHGDVSNPANDCGAPGAGTGCGHLIAGTVRVWETLTGAAANTSGTVTWYVNSPANLTKQSLGNRSYINQLAFEPSSQNTVIVGTNDGNVQIGFNMGGGSFTSTWVNVTDSNSVLPNRPVLDVAFDPTTTTVPIGYAAVGGFNANTPGTPGHLFQVTCTANCGSFTWSNKTGNLPDIPVDSVIANPKFPQQVFAGTDFGLYYTNDITATSPVWYRFSNGLPNVMIWDMQIDRGNTTLSLWTRSRGAYAWPLPSSPIATPLEIAGLASRKTHGAAGAFDVDLGLDGSGVECRRDGATGDYTVVFRFANTLTNVSGASVASGTGTITSSGMGADAREYLVNLTGVANQQQLSVSLSNVQDSAGRSSANLLGVMTVLNGDTNNNRTVNSGDSIQTRSRSGQPMSLTTFRSDVNCDGQIDSGDAIIVRSQSGSAVP